MQVFVDSTSFGPRRRIRAVLMAIALIAFVVVWSMLLVPTGKPIAFDDIDWPDVIGEGSIALLAVVWLLAVNRLRTRPMAFGFFAVGAVALFIAAIQDMLDEFLVFPQTYPSVLENLGKTGGLLCVTVGLLILSNERKQAEDALRDVTNRYRALSITDSLSKLFNHAFFLEELQAQVESARASGKALSLILLDIDDFKRHNDRYGHLEGDKVISALGLTIRSCVRGTDVACRYGGEEFTILLPDTAVDVAARVAERIRIAFSSVVFEPDPDTRARVTVSLGAAELNREETAQQLLHRADMAMFEAKEAGKDQVVTSR